MRQHWSLESVLESLKSGMTIPVQDLSVYILEVFKAFKVWIISVFNDYKDIEQIWILWSMEIIKKIRAKFSLN